LKEAEGGRASSLAPNEHPSFLRRETRIRETITHAKRGEKKNKTKAPTKNERKKGDHQKKKKKMEEKVLCSIRAVVYIFDGETGGWAAGPVGDGLSRVEVLENEAERTYRVLGKGMDDAEVLCIDSPLIKETQFARASETFVQWNDPQAVYGINISSVEESDTICTCIDGILKKLNEEEGMNACRTENPVVPFFFFCFFILIWIRLQPVKESFKKTLQRNKK
jgi:hypothetical protein